MRPNLSLAVLGLVTTLARNPASAEETHPSVSSVAPTPAASASPTISATAAARVLDPAVVAAQKRVDALTFAGDGVQSELRRARRTADRDRAACLDVLLTRLHVATRAGRGYLERLRDELSIGDHDGAERDQLRLELLAVRAGRLAQEARTCGRDVASAAATERSTVRVIAPALPEADAYPRP